ncbi:MAG: ROK family protein [Candidatus Aminicenantes bacterium]|nr:ROK family protein [Candidatus Aminicenantes bacterium]
MSLYVGFDLGGTQLKYGLINEKYQLNYDSKTDTPENTSQLFQLLENLWQELREKTNGKTIAAAGYGIPGIYSIQKNKILQSPNYPEIDGLNLDKIFKSFTPVPFQINNDANMAAYGEWKAGAGQGSNSIVLLTIGTGIGGGVVLNKTLWHGECGFAGEVGHIIVNHSGERCNCGNRGCLETEASGPNIVRNYLSLSQVNKKMTAKDVASRAKNGDSNAKHAFNQAGYFLGIGLGTIINVLNPDKIILGGGIMKSASLLLPPAVKEASQRSFEDSFECCEILKAQLGNKAGIIGSAAWAKDNL